MSKIRKLLSAALMLVLVTIWTPLSGQSESLELRAFSAQNTAWEVGDVFVADVSGRYKVYSNSGDFKHTIGNGLGGYTYGCAFDAKGDLYTTDLDNSKVVKYRGVDPHDVLQIIDTTLQGGRNNKSVVVAPNGDIFIGQANTFGYGNGSILRYDAAGVFQQMYDLIVRPYHSDWIDLAADRHTIFYTSGDRGIRLYDVSGAGKQLPDFATLPSTQGAAARAIRLLPPGDGSGGLLIADTLNIKRVDGSGSVIQTYDAPGEDKWESMALNPSGASFWSGDLGTGHFYRFNIETSAVELGPFPTANPAGLCIKGEITASHLTPVANIPGSALPTRTPTPTSPVGPSTTAFPYIVYILGSLVLVGGLAGLGYYLIKGGTS